MNVILLSGLTSGQITNHVCVWYNNDFNHRCNHVGSVGQSEWRDGAPHLESGFHFVPVVLRCGGKPVSSSHPFPRAER